ncbi:PAS domain-containing protein [Candidatus Phycosocius bacilliformis]|nr:PAS domain-containing protein [Candidatus Phycosocius bacilliformis]
MFRAQLLLEEQRRLFDVWAHAAAGAEMPSRESFQPRAFGPLLPFISLIETRHAEAPRVRVAGSALRDVFGDDPRTCLIQSDLPGSGETILRVARDRKPSCGVAPAESGLPGQAVRFWLRLPLGCAHEVEAVIGLDIALSGARAPNWALQRMMTA